MPDKMDLRPYAAGEDRLPWLETVGPDDRDGPSIGRVVALVLLGFAVIAGIVLTIFHFQSTPGNGNGELIPAPQNPYKVKPDEPGGLKVVGEGDGVGHDRGGAGVGEQVKGEGAVQLQFTDG